MSDFQMQIQTTIIKDIPIQNYIKDFTFIVNGEEFRTNHIIADLLSPNICKYHSSDPTFNTCIINTKQKGNFQYFINLANFELNEIPRTEFQFINEVIEFLGNGAISFYDNTNLEISNHNVLQNINFHIQNQSFYQTQIQKEIDYISSHFCEIYEEQLSELLEMPISTLEEIFNNTNLKLESEDQLLSFINKLYDSNPECSYLYEYVNFINVTSNTISDFISIFKIEDITQETWQKLSNRLKQQIIKDKETSLIENEIFIPFEQENEFKGIINYLRTQSKGKIEDEIEVKSFAPNHDENVPMNVLLFNDPDKYFFSDEGDNVWMCFVFKQNKICPTNYTIKQNDDYCHPKSWVIEASNDENSWVTLDEQNNTPYFENNPSYTFNIKNTDNNHYKFIRFRMTDYNSSEASNCIIIDSFEFYGKILPNNS